MATGERQYWVRTEQGMVWGPYPPDALERLRGRLTPRVQISTDGREYRPGTDFPELAPLLSAAPPAPAPRAAIPPAAPVRPRSHPPVTAPKANVPKPAPQPVQLQPDELRVPASGDLAAASATRLYAVAAATNATGLLTVDTPEGASFRISFRKGTPEQVSSDDNELGIFRFLLDKKVLNLGQVNQAEAHRIAGGSDPVSVLFQLQLIPAADAHRLLGEHSLYVLDRALATWRGTFTFDADATPSASAFPLGGKWALLAEASRRLDAATLRARLGRKLQRRVQRSGGNAVGNVDELALNAQETRLYGTIDGRRTGDDVLKSAPDASGALRLLHLLTELGHLSFDEQEVEPERPAPEPPKEVATPAPAPAPAAAQPAKPPAPKPLPAAAKPVKPASKPPPPKPAPAPRPEPQADAAPPPPRQEPVGSIPEQLAALRAVLTKFEKADHFTVLNLPRPKANATEARKCFFALAREYHPDTVIEGQPAEMRELKQAIFARINEAAEVLGDDERRKEYEAELAGEARNLDVGNIFAAEDAFGKAELLIKARKFVEGLDAIEEAIKLHADEGEFYAWRGWAKFMVAKDKKLQHTESLADMKKALKLNPRCSPCHMFQGQMSKILGDLKTAEKEFKKVLELDENNIEAQRELRYLWPGKKG